QIVIMGMSSSFIAVVQEALGKTVIIAAKFHFCRYIYWVLAMVRRRVQQHFHAYDRKKWKRMKHVFHKAKDKLNNEERWLLERYLSMSEELKKAYELKEAFRAWFTRAKEIGSTQIKKVKYELEQLLIRFKTEGILEMSDVIKT